MLKGRLTVPTALFGIVALYSLINPLRTEHFAMLGAAAGFWFLSRTTRHFVLSFTPFLLFTWIYDLLRVFSDGAAGRSTVFMIHRLENGPLALPVGQERLSPNELLATIHHSALDLIGGVWYASHVLVVIVLGVYLWWRHQREREHENRYGVLLHRFLWGFLVMNLAMFAFNLFLPVAPPWFVSLHGYAIPDGVLAGHPGGLERIDTLLGIDYFSSVYDKNAYVFGAFPSGHTAYAVWFALHVRGSRLLRAAAYFYAAVMGFYAMYLNHHYLLDVLGGTLLATSVYLVFARTALRRFPCAVQAYLRRRFLQESPLESALRPQL